MERSHFKFITYNQVCITPVIIYIPSHTLIITGSTYFRFFQQFPFNYFYDSDSNDNNIFMIFHIQNQKSNIICISNFYLQITKETKHKDTKLLQSDHWWWSKSVLKCSIITSASLTWFGPPPPPCVTIWLHPPNL